MVGKQHPEGAWNTNSSNPSFPACLEGCPVLVPQPPSELGLLLLPSWNGLFLWEGTHSDQPGLTGVQVCCQGHRPNFGHLSLGKTSSHPFLGVCVGLGVLGGWSSPAAPVTSAPGALESPLVLLPWSSGLGDTSAPLGSVQGGAMLPAGISHPCGRGRPGAGIPRECLWPGGVPSSWPC